VNIIKGHTVARDRHHNAVVKALEKEGWTVAPKAFRILSGTRNLYIDMYAAKMNSDAAVFVEVKSFQETESPIERLAQAMGQYQLYRLALNAIGDSTILYLAIPQSAFDGIFSEPVGQMAIVGINMQLLVYDPASEVIVQWITR
jgi:Holliday junction resolvase-like predicted endonuclease